MMATLMDTGQGRGTWCRCGELASIMGQDDYGFAPKKLEVLVLEHIETADDLMAKWADINARAPTIGDVHLRESYIYFASLGKYLKWLCDDQGVPSSLVSIYHENEDLHYQYISYRFSQGKNA